MANHHSQVDVILGTKTDIDKLYNLLKDMPDSFDYSGTMMKAFPGEVGYFDANRITYGTAAKKSVEFKDLYFLSIPSFSFKGLGWKPLHFLQANRINYHWLVEAACSEEDPSETFWTVRNNETNQQETATTYDEEMMTFLNGRKPLPADDPRLHIQLSDFVKEGIEIFEMCRKGL
jgi:hypothetical protein